MKYFIIKRGLFQENLKGCFVMKNIEQIITSMEIAEMVEKEHKMLLRDLRRYINQFNQCKIVPVDFFRESTYKDAKGEIRPCYHITKKGCEFIAHKLTGTKGTAFTARYINRFHEMEDILKRQQKPDLPWFIRDFGKEGKIMLFRDFRSITGIELSGTYTAWKRPDRLVGGVDYNGWERRWGNDEFKEKYGFDFGDGDFMWYLYFRGIKKAIRTIENDLRDRKKLTLEAREIILNGVGETGRECELPVVISKKIEPVKQNPIQICITINGNEIVR